MLAGSRIVAARRRDSRAPAAAIALAGVAGAVCLAAVVLGIAAMMHKT